MKATKDTVEKAIFILFHSPDIQEKQNANRWLIEFVSTPDAWSVSQELLFSQNTTSQHFGAQIFCQKIRLGWYSTPFCCEITSTISIISALKE
jgi:hypothetical protein